MSTQWQCSRCGCTSNHYNSQRMGLVCDQCGLLVDDHRLVEAQQALDRAVYAAEQHLRVGNWNEGMQLLRPLCSQYPCESRIYSLLIKAITKGYTDVIVRDNAYSREAWNYWDKLIRLQRVDQAMSQYRAARLCYINRCLTKRFLLSLFLICCMIVVLFLVGNIEAIGGRLFLIASFSFCVFAFFRWKLYRAIRQYVRFQKDLPDNPFTQV